MENGRPHPSVHAENPQENVIWFQRVRVWHTVQNELYAAIMAVEVEDGEKDAAGFLDAPETEKGPFSVELVERQVLGAEVVSDLTLTCVVTFRGTVPEEKTEMEGELACDGL